VDCRRKPGGSTGWRAYGDLVLSAESDNRSVGEPAEGSLNVMKTGGLITGPPIIHADCSRSAGGLLDS